MQILDVLKSFRHCASRGRSRIEEHLLQRKRLVQFLNFAKDKIICQIPLISSCRCVVVVFVCLFVLEPITCLRTCGCIHEETRTDNILDFCFQKMMTSMFQFTIPLSRNLNIVGSDPLPRLPAMKKTPSILTNAIISYLISICL